MFDDLREKRPLGTRPEVSLDLPPPLLPSSVDDLTTERLFEGLETTVSLSEDLDLDLEDLEERGLRVDEGLEVLGEVVVVVVLVEEVFVVVVVDVVPDFEGFVRMETVLRVLVRKSAFGLGR